MFNEKLRKLVDVNKFILKLKKNLIFFVFVFEFYIILLYILIIINTFREFIKIKILFKKLKFYLKKIIFIY